MILCGLLQTEDLVLQRLMNKFTFMGPGLESIKVSARPLNWLCSRTINTDKHMCWRITIYACKISFNASAWVLICQQQPLEVSSVFKLLNLVFFCFLLTFEWIFYRIVKVLWWTCFSVSTWKWSCGHYLFFTTKFQSALSFQSPSHLLYKIS